MRFGILGPTQVWHADGQPIAVGGPRVRALLARLLLDPGRLVGTDRLIDDLYGADPPAGAANALQSQVSRLRRAMPETVAVEFHPAGYRLAVEPDTVDAHRFARLAADGHAALESGDALRALAALREALGLWRGPALADLTDVPFAPAHAAHLEELRLAAVEDRNEAELALGEQARMVPELRQLVAAHPLRERLRGQLMRALAGSGRQAEALTEYERLRRTLAEELGADPSPELAELHRAVLRGAPPPAPAAAGLPAHLTSFVGREEELHRVGKLLGEVRLVTITGPGGAGKTRLAVEVAGHQPGDACFVDLAPLMAGADLPHAVVTALGLREAGLRTTVGVPPSPVDRLIAALADRSLLLVFDNCEQVIAEAARLADRLLGACPRLRVLATSREPLGLIGEALYPISGLAQPPADVELSDALRYPAVRLFADRAADVSPGFTVDDRNLEPVLRIARTLDGLPLAIELAAARLRSLPVAELAARLDDRFGLLTRGARTAPPRHRTLRAVVEWSWDLLTGPEQALARRLTVFAGGATLAAAERVADGTVDLLAGLVEKSLVEPVDGRYRMLETIRAYAAERLADAGETDRLRRAHAAYFLDLAWTADPHLRTADQLAWLSRLDAERDNLHAAVRAATAAGELDQALQLVTALSSYWWLRGLRSEAGVLAGEVLAALPGGSPLPGREEEYALCVLTTALAGGREDVAPAIRVLRELSRPPRQPVLFLLSALATGPPEEDQLRDETLAPGEILGDDPWALALEPLGMGYVQLWAGKLAEAEAGFAAALASFRALGERWGMTNALAGLADVADQRGERGRSVALINEALRLAEQLESLVDIADLLRLRGDVETRQGALDRAEADFRRAVTFARRAGAVESLATARLGLAGLASRRGDLAEARRQAETGLAECPAGWFAADQTRADLQALLASL